MFTSKIKCVFDTVLLRPKKVFGFDTQPQKQAIRQEINTLNSPHIHQQIGIGRKLSLPLSVSLSCPVNQQANKLPQTCIKTHSATSLCLCVCYTLTSAVTVRMSRNSANARDAVRPKYRPITPKTHREGYYGDTMSRQDFRGWMSILVSSWEVQTKI